MPGRLFLIPRQIFTEVLPVVCDIKAKMATYKLFLLSILAGMYIGFGAIFATTTMTAVEPFGIKKLIGGTVFSVGLMLVIIAGAELFTGNVLMSLTCLAGKIKLSGVFRNWLIVYIGNFIGSVILAWMFVKTGLWGTPENVNGVGMTALNIASAKVSLDWSAAFFRGMLCNILVNLAIIMATSAQTITGKVFAVLFPISAFVSSGFEHSIANMYFVSTGIFIENLAKLSDFSNISWGAFITNNLIPVTLGNIVGPIIFVVIPYYLIYYTKDK